MVISRLSGMGAWLIQRISAIYMAVYLPLYGALSWNLAEGYSGWHALNAHPAIVVGNVLLFAAVLLHSWVGVRDIIVDYIKPTGLRVALLALVAASLGVMALWLLRIFLVLTA
jgi:succinate dehydrogenase / fumarate reductase membrane anchor subunit